MKKWSYLVIPLVVLSVAGCTQNVNSREVPITQFNAPNAHYWTYIVKSGDTLSGVAEQYKMSYVDLARLNHIPAPYAINVGQVLKVPNPKFAVNNVQTQQQEYGGNIEPIHDPNSLTAHSIDLRKYSPDQNAETVEAQSLPTEHEQPVKKQTELQQPKAKQAKPEAETQQAKKTMAVVVSHHVAPQKPVHVKQQLSADKTKADLVKTLDKPERAEHTTVAVKKAQSSQATIQPKVEMQQQSKVEATAPVVEKPVKRPASKHQVAKVQKSVTVTTSESAAKPKPKPTVVGKRVSIIKQTTKDGITWSWPVPGRIIQDFGAGPGVMAKGIEIRTGSNTKVLAAAEGTVIYSGTGVNDYGKMIIIKSQGNFLTAYTNLSKLLVNQGEKIIRGGPIGIVGTIDGEPVLHFEVRKFGSPVDPMQYMP